MPETEKQPVVIDIRPRNQQDYRLVGINNKIQVVDSKVAKLRKFLEKRALLRLQTHE